MTPTIMAGTQARLIEDQVYTFGRTPFTSKDLKERCRSSGTRLEKITDRQLDDSTSFALRTLVKAGRVEIAVKGRGRGAQVYRCTTPVATTAAQQQATLVHYGHEINRRAAVEQEIWNAVNGKAPLPDVEQLRKWALKLGVPDCECFKN